MLSTPELESGEKLADLLQWWHLSAVMYYVLSLAAYRIPATSVPFQRLFSTAGVILYLSLPLVLGAGHRR